MSIADFVDSLLTPQPWRGWMWIAPGGTRGKQSQKGLNPEGGIND